ncbi:MAG TPA: hypothetical protein ENN07_03375 [candidate division Zixibacteria bacterium]|nr:hypothetical protein [candidate division Zixibacteria bacterium]
MKTAIFALCLIISTPILASRSSSFMSNWTSGGGTSALWPLNVLSGVSVAVANSSSVFSVVHGHALAPSRRKTPT